MAAYHTSGCRRCFMTSLANQSKIAHATPERRSLPLTGPIIENTVIEGGFLERTRLNNI